MSEYIRKEDVLNLPQSIERNLRGEIVERSIDVKAIEALEPADVVQVVHAYWIDTDNYYRRWRCSACSGHTKEAHPPVCPFCGAKMDGGENG